MFDKSLTIEEYKVYSSTEKTSYIKSLIKFNKSEIENLLKHNIYTVNTYITDDLLNFLLNASGFLDVSKTTDTTNSLTKICSINTIGRPPIIKSLFDDSLFNDSTITPYPTNNNYKNKLNFIDLMDCSSYSQLDSKITNDSSYSAYTLQNPQVNNSKTDFLNDNFFTNSFMQNTNERYMVGTIEYVVSKYNKMTFEIKELTKLLKSFENSTETADETYEEINRDLLTCFLYEKLQSDYDIKNPTEEDVESLCLKLNSLTDNTFDKYTKFNKEIDEAYKKYQKEVFYTENILEATPENAYKTIDNNFVVYPLFLKFVEEINVIKKEFKSKIQKHFLVEFKKALKNNNILFTQIKDDINYMRSIDAFENKYMLKSYFSNSPINTIITEFSTVSKKSITDINKIITKYAYKIKDLYYNTNTVLYNILYNFISHPEMLLLLNTGDYGIENFKDDRFTFTILSSYSNLSKDIIDKYFEYFNINDLLVHNKNYILEKYKSHLKFDNTEINIILNKIKVDDLEPLKNSFIENYFSNVDFRNKNIDFKHFLTFTDSLHIIDLFFDKINIEQLNNHIKLIQENKNLTTDFIVKHKELNWDWFNLDFLKSLLITDNLVDIISDKYWIIEYLLSNTHSFSLDHLRKLIPKNKWIPKFHSDYQLITSEFKKEFPNENWDFLSPNQYLIKK